MHVGTSESKRIDQHQLAHQAWVLQRQLECYPPAQRGAHERRGAKPATLHIPLDKTREIWDAVSRARFLAAAKARQVGSVDAMPAGRRFEVEAPLDIAG